MRYLSVKLGFMTGQYQIKLLCVYLKRIIQILTKRKPDSMGSESLAFPFRFWMGVHVG